MGRCRAWIRLAVNECALENYIGVLCQDESLLKYVVIYLKVYTRTIYYVRTLKILALDDNPTWCIASNMWHAPKLLFSGIQVILG